MKIRLLKTSFILSILLLIVSPPPNQCSAGSDILVTSNLDHGPGSLRNAIQQVQPGERIHFDPITIPSDHPARIMLGTPLPRLSVGGVMIDGSGIGVILDGSQLQGKDYPVFVDDVEVTFDGGENVIENGDFIRSILVWNVLLYIESGY